MKKVLLLSLFVLLPQVAAAEPPCDLIQVQCLPSINEVQVKVHERGCYGLWKYTDEELAAYEKDNIYRPYQKWEHDKPLEPLTFSCEMDGQTVKLEVGATKPDPSAPGVSGNCVDHHGYLSYTKWFVDDKAVSEKLYFENYSYCLANLPGGKKHIYQMKVEPRANNTLKFVLQHGFEDESSKGGVLYGKPNKPVTYEDVLIKDFPDWRK